MHRLHRIKSLNVDTQAICANESRVIQIEKVISRVEKSDVPTCIQGRYQEFFNGGANSSDKEGRMRFSGYYNCQKSPKK